MRVKRDLWAEYEEVSGKYAEKDSRGKDIVALVSRFAESVESQTAAYAEKIDKGLLTELWHKFSQDHVNMMTVDMYQNVLYLLITYWSRGEELWPILHPLEKLAVTELVYEFSEEIKKRSEAAAAG